MLRLVFTASKTSIADTDSQLSAKVDNLFSTVECPKKEKGLGGCGWLY
jgi:hypothetical protein